MASFTETTDKFPKLCIPRGMLFHTPDFVEKAFNQAMRGKFVKSIESKTTRDKSGAEFNTFFITPNQDFPENASTTLVYKNIQDQGFVNISTGKGRFFWKVKLYVPNLKAKYIPVKDNGPKIMDAEDTKAFIEWQRERQAAKKARSENKGPWDQQVEEIEEGELDD